MLRWWKKSINVYVLGDAQDLEHKWRLKAIHCVIKAFFVILRCSRIKFADV